MPIIDRIRSLLPGQYCKPPCRSW